MSHEKVCSLGRSGDTRDRDTLIQPSEFASWPVFGDEEITAAHRVLKSGKVNYWTGKEGYCFGKEFAAYVGVGYAIPVANGSVALELALHALGIGHGDDVVVTCRSFVASASSIVLCGARPIFADVDPVSQNITASSILSVLTRDTRAIIAVHFAGWPCDMDSILNLAKENGLYVIEDCAQAHGARYKGQSVGSIAHVAAWSFCQDKIMSTGGEGGMLTTNNEDLWKRAWAYKDHGKSYDAVYNREHPPGFRWLHESFGTNWRMTEMQAAIGSIQLGRLQSWHAQRQKNASALAACFEGIPALRVTRPPEWIKHAYYKYYVFVRPKKLKPKWDRDRIMNAITSEGVPCNSGSCSELYLEKAFDNTGWRPKERLPVARELGETSLMFLVHPTLTERDIRATSEAVEKIMHVASIT